MRLNYKYLSAQTILSIAGILVLASASAHAEIFTYEINIDQIDGATETLTIDTNAGTATLIGSGGKGTNATFFSNGFKTFTGGEKPSGMFELSNVTGYISYKNIKSNYSNEIHNDKIILDYNGDFGTHDVFIWSYWGENPNRRGDIWGGITKYTPPPTESSSSGTTSSGTTSSGTTSSGTTTSVPAPAALLLFGIGLTGLALRRRRQKI